MTIEQKIISNYHSGPSSGRMEKKMETTDWLLFIVMSLLTFILRELYTLRTMAQAWAKMIFDAGERGDIQWLIPIAVSRAS
jgi:hypothetical protein